MEFQGEREQLVPKVVVYLRQSHMKIFSIFKNGKKGQKNICIYSYKIKEIKKILFSTNKRKKMNPFGRKEKGGKYHDVG